MRFPSNMKNMLQKIPLCTKGLAQLFRLSLDFMLYWIN